MVDSDNITTETTVVATANKGQIIRIALEKLDGGYVCDATGRRSIYKDADEILDVLDMTKMINKLDNDEYHMGIIIMPKGDYQDMEDRAELAVLHTNEDLSLESAKESGIIESAEKFNPLPTMVEPDISGPIKITAANCYTTARLKAIDWKKWDEELEMSIIDKAAIAGIKKTSFYATWNSMMKGKYSYQRTEVKIGLTILAQYYEKNLGIRTSTKEAADMMKQQMIDCIRDVELMTNKQQWVKSSELMKKLNVMKNSLLK